MTLNSSANFFIYTVTSLAFRRVLKNNLIRMLPVSIQSWWRTRNLSLALPKTVTTGVNGGQNPNPNPLLSPGDVVTLNGKDLELHDLQGQNYDLQGQNFDEDHLVTHHNETES